MAKLQTWEERVVGALQDFRTELAIQTSPSAKSVLPAVERLLEFPEYVHRLTAILSDESGGTVFPQLREGA